MSNATTSNEGKYWQNGVGNSAHLCFSLFTHNSAWCHVHEDLSFVALYQDLLKQSERYFIAQLFSGRHTLMRGRNEEKKSIPVSLSCYGTDAHLQRSACVFHYSCL